MIRLGKFRLTDYKETEYESVNWINLTQGCDQWGGGSCKHDQNLRIP
jgi:hypothetical protein